MLLMLLLHCCVCCPLNFAHAVVVVVVVNGDNDVVGFIGYRTEVLLRASSHVSLISSGQSGDCQQRSDVTLRRSRPPRNFWCCDSVCVLDVDESFAASCHNKENLKRNCHLPNSLV